MQYFGGKFRIRRQIAELINSYNPVLYLEPFCGSAWVAELVEAQLRVCCDLNSDLVAMWQAVQYGWEPPGEITQEQYYEIKAMPSPNPLKAFAGFGCSFAGKYFGGYARGHGADAKTAKSQLNKRMYAKTEKSQGLKDVHFNCVDYEAAITLYDPDIVYCDPPYKGTTKFYGLPEFDHSRFWDVMYEESYKRVVLISEYEAPKEFEAVLSIPTKTEIRSSAGERIPRVEKVFKLR
jgi:DNA adenine methylase